MKFFTDQQANIQNLNTNRKQDFQLLRNKTNNSQQSYV